MSDVATRKDIDEIIGIVRDFMEQVDNRFNNIELDLSTVKKDVAETKQEIIDLKCSQ